MSFTDTTNVVIPGFMPGIQSAACSGVCGWLDPGDKPRDDDVETQLLERAR